MFDGKAFVEILTKPKEAKDKVDENGNKVVYRNSYFQRRVSFEEMALTLNDDSIKKLFKTTENFAALAEEDAEYF